MLRSVPSDDWEDDMRLSPAIRSRFGAAPHPGGETEAAGGAD